MQVYITVAQLLYCDYPIGKMSCPLMSVTFNNILYPIPQKMTSKRFARFRGYHAYKIERLSEGHCSIPLPPSLEK